MIGLAAAAMLIASPSGSWTQHYTKAASLFGDGKRDEAVVEFYIGQLRGRTNVSCVKQDPSGGPALIGSLNQVIGQPLNEYVGASPDKWIRSIDSALAWDGSNPDAENGSTKCVSEKARQREGLMKLRRMIDTERASIREERRKNGLPNE